MEFQSRKSGYFAPIIMGGLRQQHSSLTLLHVSQGLYILQDLFAVNNENDENTVFCFVLLVCLFLGPPCHLYKLNHVSTKGRIKV